MAALGLTLGLAIVSGTITGFLMRLPIFEQIDEVDELYVMRFFLTFEITFIYLGFFCK
jgi:hypothetical protein